MAYCVLITRLFEGCIQCGLIQNNTEYENLFMVSKLGTQITNQENAVCLASPNAMKLGEEQRKCVETHTIYYSKTF